MQKNNKLLAVEGIRGVACFVVVIAHLTLFFFPYLYMGVPEGPGNEIQKLIRNSPFAFFYSGLAAVYIFFVLSGYILSAVALSSGRPLIKIFSMSLKRYPRLGIPAVFSCVLAFLLLYSIDFRSLSHPLLVGPFSPGSLWGTEAIFGNFSYSFKDAAFSGAIEVFFLSGHSLYNPVLWTMKIELIGSFLVYILCAALVFDASNEARLRRIAFSSKVFKSLPLLMLTIILLLIVTKEVDHRFGIGLISFIAGFIFRTRGVYISSTTSTLMVLAGLYLAGAHNGSVSYGWIEAVLGKYTYEVCNALSGFIIVYAIIFGKNLYTLFSHPFAVFMGKVSFSVYIVHFLMIATLGVHLFGVFFAHFASYELAAALASVTTILATYIFSIFVYKYVDSNGMAIGNFISRAVTSRIGLRSSSSTVVNNKIY